MIQDKGKTFGITISKHKIIILKYEFSFIFLLLPQLHEENEDQVGELLDILIQKTNRDFENFCDALDAVGRGGVVRNLLITPGNV